MRTAVILSYAVIGGARPPAARTRVDRVRVLLFASLAAFVALAGCEPDNLSQMKAPPHDAGFRDAAMPPPPPPADAGMEPIDTGVMMPPPDAGFAPDAMMTYDSGTPPATERIYVHTTSILYSYDPTRADVTPIGAFLPFDGESMIDIAIDLQGRMYGGSFSGGIYAVNPLNAVVTFLYRVNDHPTGLTFLSDGRLVVAGQRITIIDPLSGAVTGQLTQSTGPTTSGDIIGLPGEKLYATVLTATPDDDLVTVDPHTGAVQRVGGLGIGAVYGLGYFSGTLYGFANNGDVLEIDPTSAAVLSTQHLAQEWYGATTNPVLW